MASVLAFNKMTVDSTSVEQDDFVTGSGVFRMKGADKTVNTADGMIHRWRTARSCEASARLYGDMRSLSCVRGMPRKVALYLDDIKITEFSAQISVTYESDPSVSSITLNGTPLEE